MGTLTKKNKTGSSVLERARAIQPNAPVITGPFAITINNDATTGSAYIGWSPAAASIHITNAPQPGAVNVVLQNRNTAIGGQMVFRSAYASAPTDTLALSLPGDGSPLSFFVSGKFGSPSVEDGDAAIAVTDATTHAVLHQRNIMVRIRKNANTLTPAERDRFLSRFVQINNSADYNRFLNSHNDAANLEIHQRPAFLPWHRVFVLDLERRLQALDPSITIPYWRFDQSAPNVFTDDFMGGHPNGAGRLTFSATNPLRLWLVDGVTGLVRLPRFNTSSGSPTDVGLMSQDDTFSLGSTFLPFRRMESNPHGSAHTSFTGGPLFSPLTSTKDPIFFLLHCNVDRLWANWQKRLTLWNAGDANTYSPAYGNPIDQSPRAVGDQIGDTMWPWNEITGTGGANRPPTSPSGPLPQLSFPAKPSAAPTVGETIDYIGVTQGNSNFFDYDDVSFL